MIDELKIFHELLSIINTSASIEELPERLLVKIISLLNSEAGSIFLLDEETKMIRAVASAGPKSAGLKKTNIEPGYGICGKVIERGKTILENNAYQSGDFNPEIDKMTGYITRNVVCVPILLRSKVTGAIEVINKKAGAFDEEDRQIMELVAKYLSFPIENSVLSEKYNEEKIRNESVIENMPGGLLIIDIDDKIIGYNRKAAQILEIAQYSAKGRNYREAFRQLPDFVILLESYIKIRQFAYRKEIRLYINKKEKRIGYSTFIIRRKDDKIIGMGVSFQDIS